MFKYAQIEENPEDSSGLVLSLYFDTKPKEKEIIDTLVNEEMFSDGDVREFIKNNEGLNFWSVVPSLLSKKAGWVRVIIWDGAS